MRARSTRSRPGCSCCSRARRRGSQPRFVGLDKRYVTEVDLTATTSTGDPEGEVVERARAAARRRARSAARGLRGEVELPIPAASAVKIGGRARVPARIAAGVAVEMPLRRSRVHALDVVGYDGRRGRARPARQLRDLRALDRGGARRSLPDAPPHRDRAVLGRRGRTPDAIIAPEEALGEARRVNDRAQRPERARAARRRARSRSAAFDGVHRGHRAVLDARDGDRAAADGDHVRPAPADRARQPGRAARRRSSAGSSCSPTPASRRRSSSSSRRSSQRLEPEEFADALPARDRRRARRRRRGLPLRARRAGDLALLERLGFDVVVGSRSTASRRPRSARSSARATSRRRAAARPAVRGRRHRRRRRPARRHARLPDREPRARADARRARSTGSTRARRSATARRSRSAPTRTTAAPSGGSRRSCSTSRATSTASAWSSSSGSGCATRPSSSRRRSSSSRSRATSTPRRAAVRPGP